MAGALGERVYRGDTMQIGFRRVEPTEAGATSPIRHFDGVPVVEWHGDTFELPEQATLLASSSDYSNEAFAIGDFALAVQFHPEVTDEMHETWVADGYNELDELRARPGCAARGPRSVLGPDAGGIPRGVLRVAGEPAGASARLGTDASALGAEEVEQQPRRTPRPARRRTPATWWLSRRSRSTS